MSARPGLLLLFAAMLATPAFGADDSQSYSKMVFGVPNQQLADGAEALRNGRFREGVKLTLDGLGQPNDPRAVVVALSNLCAGFVALREYLQALEKCNAALEADADNWHAFNNRAAAYSGLEQYDAALRDVQAGLSINPNSLILKKSLRIVRENQRKYKLLRRNAVHS